MVTVRLESVARSWQCAVRSLTAVRTAIRRHSSGWTTWLGWWSSCRWVGWSARDNTIRAFTSIGATVRWNATCRAGLWLRWRWSSHWWRSGPTWNDTVRALSSVGTAIRRYTAIRATGLRTWRWSSWWLGWFDTVWTCKDNIVCKRSRSLSYNNKQTISSISARW